MKYFRCIYTYFLVFEGIARRGHTQPALAPSRQRAERMTSLPARDTARFAVAHARTSHHCSSPRALALALTLSLAACAPPRGTIGAVIAQEPDGRLFLREVPPDLAAGKAGLKAGDEILTIDGRDARAMSTAEVHHTLSGEVGDRVKLTLVRGDEVIRVTLTRTEARKLPGGIERR